MENPGKNKEDWPEYEKRLGKYSCSCPFCEIYSCKYCPLTLKGMECSEDENNNPFDIWLAYLTGTGTAAEATQAALTIANVFQEEIDKITGSTK